MSVFIGDKILIATHNRGKFEEFESLFAPYGVRTLFAGDLDLDAPEESETTFVGNARIKAHAGAGAMKCPALADDSGLEVEALGNAPGVYTADWAETPRGRDFEMAMRRIWDELETICAPLPHRARFRCTLVLAWPDGHERIFEGAIRGEIVRPMRGAQGHGYDPIFMPEGYDRTLGEMNFGQKNKISHRANAMNRFISEMFEKVT